VLDYYYVVFQRCYCCSEENICMIDSNTINLQMLASCVTWKLVSVSLEDEFLLVRVESDTS